ncbi:MAG TPA: murein biosynthesis integral membrane protein MurJ [Candidatus Saccharimonadales bacterium]|nr:murein biosynthesis integral membrane protein MurJ [Candidatus Saccharimonadales bacterium]
MAGLFQKSIALLTRRQTNIISAAFVVMATLLLSQFLGLIRERLMFAQFGGARTGLYLVASKLPDAIFQLIIAGALSSAFIPVFTDFLTRNEEKEAYKMASTLLSISMILFSIVSIILFAFPEFFLHLLNPGSGFSTDQIALMASLMRIIIVGELLFILGSFLTAILQSYNHFFIPGIAAALYNLGIVMGIVLFGSRFGIFSAVYGVLIGAAIFVLMQIPMAKKVGFSFFPSLAIKTKGVPEVLRLMLPRTVAIGVTQLSAIAILGLVSFLANAGRNYAILNYAQTLMFAPVVLFGQTIAQASLPILSREKDKPELFRATFSTSFTQTLYLVLPISALFLVLRIPVVRLVFGAGQFDWQATVATGNTLAYFSLSIFAQALIYLVSRGFYALHDTKTPLIVNSLGLVITILVGALLVLNFHQGIEALALSYSIGYIVYLVVLLYFLDRKVKGLARTPLLFSSTKILLATLCAGFALYIPIKLLDQLVFDTTHTINLLLLTGISSLAGLMLYLFLTWLFDVKEAMMFILLFKKIGNWREILGIRSEMIEPHVNQNL